MNRGWAILGVLLIALLIFGCAGAGQQPPANQTSAPPQSNTPTPNNTQTPAPNGGNQPSQQTGQNTYENPTYIGNFATYEQGNNLVLYFSLYDANKNFVSASGTASVRIVSNDGTIVYSGVQDVAKGDFATYTRTLTQQQFQAYEWKIPLSQINKSSETTGIVSLQFTTTSGVQFGELNSSVYNLPQFSKEEVAQQEDEAFNKTAITLNMKKQIGNYILVEVTDIGLMNITEFSTTKEYIRADIIVTNMGTDKMSYYRPSPVILGKNNNQFEEAYVSSYTYPGVFENGDIYPGVIKKGAILFEVKDTDNLNLSSLIIDTGLSSWDQQSKNLAVGQAQLDNDEYFFTFDLSNVKLKP